MVAAVALLSWVLRTVSCGCVAFVFEFREGYSHFASALHPVCARGGPFKNKRELEGKLFERTFDELTITQSGRKVRIPLALVDEVRLPPALIETGDFGP